MSASDWKPYREIISLSSYVDEDEDDDSTLGKRAYHRDEDEQQTAELDWTLLEPKLAALRKGQLSPEQMMKLGERLGNFLKRTGWSKASLEAAVREKRPIRLTIRSRARELYALPWELLVLPDSALRLAEVSDLLIRFSWPRTDTVPRASTEDGGRILFAWAGDVQPKQHGLGIQNACNLGFLSPAEELPNATLQSIVEKLDEAAKDSNPYTIIHILCHGAESRGRPGLLLEDVEEGQTIVDGPRLAGELVRHAKTLRLVVLCACHGGGTGDPGSHLAGVAQHLHRVGIEAVIASRFRVSLDAATRFTQVFYERLLEAPASVEAAFVEARDHLRRTTSEGSDYLFFQLYGRAEDGDDTRPVILRPYRGLEPFREPDRRFFFGRDAQREEAVRKLEALSAEQEAKLRTRPRLVIVTGASGSGKSSVVLAGVVPDLQKRGWNVAPAMKPGNSPLAALAHARKKLPPEVEKCVLVVDQFEEIFTHLDARKKEDREQRDAFVRELWALASAVKPCIAVVMTLRIDFIGRCGDIVLDPESGQLFDSAAAFLDEHRVMVPQMTREALREAIERPATMVGLELEPGLRERMVADVGLEPGALPLLQHALLRVWEGRAGRRLTHAAYDDLAVKRDERGNVVERAPNPIAGALEQTAEDALRALGKPGDATWEAAKRILVGLVTAREDTGLDTRRRVPQRDLYTADGEKAAVYEGVIRHLVERRLVVQDELFVGGERLASLEIAHEALIRSWKQLRKWVEEARTRQNELGQFDIWLGEQLRFSKQLNERQIAHARVLLEKYPDDVGSKARALIEDSVAALEAEKRAEAEQRDRERGFALVAGARELLARGQIAWASKVLLEVPRPEVARGWVEAAREILESLAPQFTVNFGDGVSRFIWSPDNRRIAALVGGKGVMIASAERVDPAIRLQGSEGRARSLDWRGNRIAIGYDCGKVRLFFADGTADVVVLEAHERSIEFVAFNGGGDRLLTASGVNARIWDVDQGVMIAELRGHESLLRTGMWSPDGRRVITASYDKTARVWDAVDGRLLVVLRGHRAFITVASFSPNGTRMLTASDDHTARIWEGDALVAELIAHRGPINQAVWSPDGTRIATASHDGTAMIWRTDVQEHPLLLAGHESAVGSVAFDPHGERLITVSSDGTARLWDAKGGVEIAVLRRRNDGAGIAAFDSAGKRIVTSSDMRNVMVSPSDPIESSVKLRGRNCNLSADGRSAITIDDTVVHCWDVDAPRRPKASLSHPVPVSKVLLDACGTHAVTTDKNNVLRVWSLGKDSAPILEFGAVVTNVRRAFAMNPGGTHVAAVCHDGCVRVWSVGAPSRPPVVIAGGAAACSVSFSPDGARLAVVFVDQLVMVHDVVGTREPIYLRGHEERVFIGAHSWSRNGELLSTVSDDGTTASGTVRIWRTDCTNNHIVWQCPFMYDAAIDQDGQRVAITMPDAVLVRRVDGTGPDVRIPTPVMVGSPLDVMFSPDGRRLLITTPYHKAWVADADGHGEPIVLDMGSRGPHDLLCALFRTNGEQVVAATMDGTVRVFRVTYSALAQALREMNRDCLPPKLRQRYLDETAEQAETAYKNCMAGQGTNAALPVSDGGRK